MRSITIPWAFSTSQWKHRDADEENRPPNPRRINQIFNKKRSTGCTSNKHTKPTHQNGRCCTEIPQILTARGLSFTPICLNKSPAVASDPESTSGCRILVLPDLWLGNQPACHWSIKFVMISPHAIDSRICFQIRNAGSAAESNPRNQSSVSSISADLRSNALLVVVGLKRR